MKAQLIHVVEDNYFYANLIKARVSKLHPSCIRIYRTFKDFQRDLSDKPDIVFLDQNLPDCKGVDFISSIIEQSPKSKIIVMSSQEKLSVACLSISRGARFYLVKNHDEIKETLNKMINSCIRNDYQHPTTEVIRLINHPNLRPNS